MADESPSPQQLAEREWPTLRARLVDVAAALDRLDRLSERAGDGGCAEAEIARFEAKRMLEVILEPGDADRAERVLTMLSRSYDPIWRERFAAGETRPDREQREPAAEEA